MRSIIIFAAASLLVCGVAEAQEQATPRRTEPIPKHFKTYSLFLICNSKWLYPNKSLDLDRLYDGFQGFARAIGRNNVAVWFMDTPDEHNVDTQVARRTDVDRSADFCSAWQLKPSDGPHIVVTGDYPDEHHLTALKKNYAVYSLGNMSPQEITDLLAKLTDQLILTGKVDASASSSPKLWVQLLSATQQTLNSFGCAWSFKISAGPIDASLKACKPT